MSAGGRRGRYGPCSVAARGPCWISREGEPTDTVGIVEPMDSGSDRTQIERWVMTWRDAEPALAEQKRAELERLVTPRALAELAAAFAHALRRAPVSDTSGLIEQQRYFQLLGRCSSCSARDRKSVV